MISGSTRLAGVIGDPVRHSLSPAIHNAAYADRFQQGLAGKSVLVIGAGGAARSIIEAVGRAGASRIVIANRSADRAADAATLAPQATVGVAQDQEQTSAADVIINATAVGMAGGPDPTGVPVPLGALHAGQHVIDIVYQPRLTPLLAGAKATGAEVADGVGMLVHQAALAFERWTGQEAPVEVMAAAVDASTV